MAKQVSEILVRLGIQGAEGLDKLKSSFRELEKSLGPSAETIERARKGIVDFGKESKNTEQLIKGQIEALRGLQSQTERGSTAWAELAGDIERFRQASRKTDGEIQVLRQSILSVALGTDQSQKSLREYISDLSRLRSEATITGGTFQELSRDIAALTGRLQEAEQQTQKTGRAFGRVLGQAFASTSAGLRKQLDGIRELINEQQGIVDSIDLLSRKERELADNQERRASAQIRLNRALAQQRGLQYAESVRAGREMARAGAGAFNDPDFPNFERIRQQYGDLPDTTAGLNQELTELSERLLNTTRGSNLYVETANRMAEIQRELRTELTGTAEAFRRLGIAQDGVERRAGKLADIQEYYRTQGPLAPGVGGYRDPATGAMIMAGARTPGRIRVEESAYPTPIGPQPFPEAGRRAQEQIQQSLDDVNRIYEDARIRRVEIQTKYDQIHIDKLLEGLELEGQVRDKGFRDELAAFDRQLEARDRKRRRRLTTGQAVQSAGAIISGGIFGGPEGLLGGLGGFAAGLAIPGLGPVGGAFAGAAGGAQVGAIRQQLGAFAEQAAEISKLRRGLAGVSVDLKDFEEALQATQRASDSLLLPLGQTIRFYTQLRASTVELNYSAEDTRQVLEGTASAVLKTGGSLDDVNGAMRAVIQILSKGKVSAEELRGQLGERLPGAVIKFAQENKISVQELDKAFESGSVTLEQFFNFARKNYEDGAKYANDMAAGTEFAGQRMEKALERLRLAIGSRLKESGAGFQNFVTEVVDSLLWAGRELERFGAKVETFLGSRQFGVSGSSQQIAERIIGGGLSVQDLENAIKAYEGKIAEVEKRFGTQGQRNVFQQLFDATFGEGTVTESQLLNAKAFYLDLIKKLQAAREQAEKATRDGKGGADGANQNAEDLKERQKLGEKYLQALEQREEALANARLQREEQIAQIRKNAIEQAFQIERQLADERRNIERDMERVRREMQYGAEEIDRLRRLAEGEDPAVIEAERKAAEISQQATESRIKIEEDLLDKELEQQRTIADFQKNTAKQIADANQAYAKRVGEIQKDFAKESAKIIEEGSGKAARKITLAAQIISQVLQRSALNQQRAQYGLQAIGEPTGFTSGQPMYGQMSGDEVPAQIKRIDINLEQLLKKLQQSRVPQGGLPSARISATGIGEQFLGMLGAEPGYEDVAGLLPGRGFDISRMTRTLGNVATASTASLAGYFPSIAQAIPGATPTTQLRQQGAQQQIQQVDQQALIKSYQVLSEIKTSSQQTLDNYKLQNREIDLQIQALTEGVEPAIAEEFSGLQANYELQQQQLELRKQALIASGQNAEAVNQAYAAESTALARIYEQNQAAIVQYQEKRKVLEQIQNASSILESNLTNAISGSIQVLVTGSGTVKEVLADMFESIGQAFIQMAAQIIAKQLVMVALGSILKALGISGGTPSGGTSFGSSYFDPATGLGNAGPNFGLAKGGVVDQNGIQPFATGGIVTRPTFFKYANGGTMQNGLMGEAGPEAIMPLKRGADGKLGVAAKLDGAMGRYRRSPGSAGGPAGGGIETESGAAAAAMQPIDVRYNVERINQVDYVTADQFQAGMRQAAAQGAKQGEQRALNSLRQNTTTRRKVGI